MHRRGVVTDINTLERTARVTFPELGNTVSAILPYADHVSIDINDRVVVLFFSENLSDGVIVASY